MSYYQIQAQQSKQSLIQDQAYSYGIMGNLFSSLECLAHRNNNCPIPYLFEYYNNFNSGKEKSDEDLINQIITQIEIFKFSYLIYIKEHKQYEYPYNLSENCILQHLENWKQYVDDNKKKYYDGVIMIIKQQNPEGVSFVDELKEGAMKKGKKGDTIDPRFLANEGIRVIEYSNSVGSNAIKEFNKNPDYKPGMVLGDKQQNNAYNNETKKNMQQAKNLQDKLDEQFVNFTLLIEELCIKYGIHIERPYPDEKIPVNPTEIINSIIQLTKDIENNYLLYKQLNRLYVLQSNQKNSETIEKYYDHLRKEIINKWHQTVIPYLETVINILHENNEQMTSNSQA